MTTPKKQKVKPVKSSKPSTKRKPRKKLVGDVSVTVPCSCCDCSTQASGGVWSCEDGVCVYIPKPTYFAVLVSDPNFALPYFARPTDLGLNCPT